MRKFTIPILILVALMAFNPKKEKFYDLVESRSDEIFSNELGNSAVGGLLAELGSGLARNLAEKFTDRTNYLVASVYTIDLDGEEHDENDWKFLGIAGQFIELQRPEALKND